MADDKQPENEQDDKTESAIRFSAMLRSWRPTQDIENEPYVDLAAHEKRRQPRFELEDK